MRRQNQIFKVVGNFLFSSLNKEFLIFLFFLLLSGAFWLMMALNETYEEELKVPVRLVGMPRNAVMTDEPADTVKVTVRDKGFTLVTYKYGHWFRPLNFKFATYANEDQGHGAIPAADIIAALWLQQTLVGEAGEVGLLLHLWCFEESTDQIPWQDFYEQVVLSGSYGVLANDGDGVCQQEGTR